MTDAETRAELERIDPGFAGLFDDLSSTVHPDRNDLKALRLLAEKHKALREIARSKFYTFGADMSTKGEERGTRYRCQCCDALIKLAKTAIKEE